MSITVIDKWRWSEKREEFPVNVEQTRQKFKRCINICRDAVMKIKTSDIKHFQQGKEIGSWLGKLLAVLSSMDICQPQEAIEPGRKAPETNGEEANPEESIMMMFVKKRQVKALPQGLLMRHQVQKGNMYLHQRVEKNLEGKLRVSWLKWKRQGKLKTLASDTSDKEILDLDLLNEESQ